MFDRVTEKPAAARWKTALIVGSAVGHGLAAAVLIITAMWSIEKLPVAVSTRIELGPKRPMGEDGPPPGKKLQLQKMAKVVAPAKKVVKHTVQPPETRTAVTPVLTTGGDTGGNATGGGGGGNGDDGGGGDTGNGRCPSPPCQADGETEPTETPKIEKQVIVPPGIAKGLRIAGNEQIQPPESVKVEMVHMGKDTLQGTFQICVGTSGAVDSIRTLKSTGYAVYDRELADEMRHWKYRPYKVGAVPAPMCTVTVFVYRMRR